MTIINRNYNADDSLNPTLNPVNVDVMTDSTDPDSVTLTFTRASSSTGICQICEYKFTKSDIEILYDFLGDAIDWMDWEDDNSTPNDNSNPSTPVTPDNSGCDTNTPNCVNCVSTNIKTPPLGPYDPQFWPTNR